MTLRVLHAHSGNQFGGVETILLTLARRADLAPDVTWRFALGWEGRLSSELTRAGAAPALVGAARLSRPWSVWAARSQCRVLLTRMPCDVMVVHSTWALALFGPVARRVGIPLVWWMHGSQRGPAWIERWAQRVRPSRVLATSRFTARYIPAAFASVPHDVVYAPVEAPSVPPHAAAAVRRDLRVPDGAVVILQASRLEAWKGHRTLLEALARLGEGGWVCWVAGGARQPREIAYRDELMEAAQRLGLAGRLVFLGERDDVATLLTAADIVVHPNTAPEGFGIALVEALYAARPLVVTDVGPTCEIVDEGCAVLVPPGDAAALAAALAGLLADGERRATLGTAGRARATERCAPDTQIAALARVFREAAR